MMMMENKMTNEEEIIILPMVLVRLIIRHLESIYLYPSTQPIYQCKHS